MRPRRRQGLRRLVSTVIQAHSAVCGRNREPLFLARVALESVGDAIASEPLQSRSQAPER